MAKKHCYNCGGVLKLHSLNCRYCGTNQENLEINSVTLKEVHSFAELYSQKFEEVTVAVKHKGANLIMLLLLGALLIIPAIFVFSPQPWYWNILITIGTIVAYLLISLIWTTSWETSKIKKAQRELYETKLKEDLDHFLAEYQLTKWKFLAACQKPMEENAIMKKYVTDWIAFTKK